MKTMHAGWFGIALLGVAGPLGLTHCSGDSATPSGDGGGSMNSGSGSSATSGASSGSTSSGAGSGSGSSSGSAASGAGSGASSSGAAGSGGGSGSDDGGGSSGSSSGSSTPTSDGGPAASNPGMVQCGSTSCDTSEKSCCQKTGDAGSDECIGPNDSCGGGTTIRCDEASDCASGLVCCNTFGSTSCASTCGGGYQECRTDSECGAQSDAGEAKKCLLQTCGGVMERGGGKTPVTTIQACAVESPPVRVARDAAPPPPTWGALAGCKAN